jgi:hypothetical protein
LIDGVVLDAKPLGSAWVATFDIGIPDILGLLDCVGVIVQIALGVKVKVGDMVAEISQPLVGSSVAGRVRRAHISREIAKDIRQSSLQVVHLVKEFGLAESGETLV